MMLFFRGYDCMVHMNPAVRYGSGRTTVEGVLCWTDVSHDERYSRVMRACVLRDRLNNAPLSVQAALADPRGPEAGLRELAEEFMKVIENE